MKRIMILTLGLLALACGGDPPAIYAPDGGTDLDVDSDTDADGDADSDTDTDADGDSDTDTDADGDTDTDVDTDADTDSDADCSYECMSYWECNSTGGTVHDEMACDGWDVCCEAGSDTDVDTDVDTDTDADTDTGPTPCDYDCMSWWECNGAEGTVHDEMECGGWDVCCELDVDTDTGSAFDTDTSEDCTGDHYIDFDWSDATITAPMTSNTSSVIPGMEYIYTATADEGTASTDFDLPCADTWYIWARGWVPDTTEEPNTFTFGVDEAASTTLQLGSGSNSWEWVQADGNTIWSAALDGGAHTFNVGGGESEGDDVYTDHPALGTIVFTNDSSFTP